MNENNIKIRCRALILNEGKLLVVKHTIDDNYYALPGGKLEKGENPQECIIREIQEELGVTIQNPKLAYIYKWEDYKNRDNIEFLFLIENGKDFVDLNNNDRSHAFEIFEILWMDKGDDINLLPSQLKNEFLENNFNLKEVKFI